MDIDGHVECDCRFKNWSEARVVEEFALGRAIEKNSAETKFVDAALKLFRG